MSHTHPAPRLSQNHRALRIGISRGHWSDIVNGKHPYPSPKTRLRLAEVFDAPMNELFTIESGRTTWHEIPCVWSSVG